MLAQGRKFASGGVTNVDISPDDLVTPSAEQLAPMMQSIMPRGSSSPMPPPVTQKPSSNRIAPMPTGKAAEPLYGGYKKGGKTKLADGGIPTSEALSPWYARAEERSIANIQPEGLINSTGAGRTDVHNISVPTGSYVVPADVVSGLSEGNTLGGASVIDRMMHSNPFGIQGGGGRHGAGPPKVSVRPPAQYKEPPDTFQVESRGGRTGKQTDGTVPIVIAGGEFLIHPSSIIKKFGTLEKGHAVLDKFVKNVRAKNVKTISKLPGPKT